MTTRSSGGEIHAERGVQFETRQEVWIDEGGAKSTRSHVNEQFRDKPKWPILLVFPRSQKSMLLLPLIVASLRPGPFVSICIMTRKQ
jgi:hypothetical protein